MIVLSHRGLDLERPTLMQENSLESFRWSLAHGYGIELDVQVNADSDLIIAHDLTAKRWSQGKLNQEWKSLKRIQLEELADSYGQICTLQSVLDLANEFPLVTLAVHFKGYIQTLENIDLLCSCLKSYSSLHSQILVFDLKIESAIAVRNQLANVGLAPSVAHEFDINRFQSVVGGTLVSVKEALEHQGLFDWVWLDEWDRQCSGGGVKAVYEETIEVFENNGFKVAIVSPELHRADGHPDSLTIQSLEQRWVELFQFSPQAICTDYPTRVLKLRGAG